MSKPNKNIFKIPDRTHFMQKFYSIVYKMISTRERNNWL